MQDTFLSCASTHKSVAVILNKTLRNEVKIISHLVPFLKNDFMQKYILNLLVPKQQKTVCHQIKSDKRTSYSYSHRILCIGQDIKLR